MQPNMEAREREFPLFNEGAKWIRADFHLHSPFVHSFSIPQGHNLNDIDLLVDLYLEKLITNEIKIAAITDYQQIRKDFFINLQNKAKMKGLYLFPGVEMSVNYGKGLHILIIFEYLQDINGINDFIKSLDQNPHDPLLDNNRRHRDISLQNDLKITLKEIKSKFNCIIIYPHPSDKNGLINACQPKEAALLLTYADAIEFIGDNELRRIEDTNLLKKDFFKHLAVIEGTDPKSFDEIGDKTRNNGRPRTTYLKLSSVSINAIRLALQDPSLRVSIYKKQEKRCDRITSVKINGTSFLKSISMDLNQDLNTIIGGRGVGKSAILETIRYCLNLPVYCDKEFREDFVKSVVGSGGKVELEVESFFGETLVKEKITRVIGQLPTVEGKNLSPVELFGERIPLILGQKELYALSLNSDYQLSLVDNLLGEEIKKGDIELKKLINALQDNSQELLSEKKKIQKKEEIEQELKTIDEHLKTFQELGVADKMAKHTTLIQDEKVLLQATGQVKEKINDLSMAFEDIDAEIERHIELLQGGKSVQKNILLEASKGFLSLKEYIGNVKGDIESRVRDYEQQIDTLQKTWQKQKREYDDEINKIKQELFQKGLAPDRYESLVKRKTQIEPLLREYEKINSKVTELERKRQQLRDKLREQRHNLFNIRKVRLDSLNKRLDNRVKIDITYLDNKERFKEELSELVRGSGISKDALKSITEKEGIDGIEISRYISLGKDKIQETFGLTDSMAQRLIGWFTDDERLFKLETLLPDDKILIKLKVEGIYKELSTLSAGQKATALLILLFAQENRILLIDQPEEDLDNRFIYEDVVKILREIKSNRQVILVTHNANIPVLGDAEQVFVLDASNNECSIVDNGSIDKISITQNIKSIMEGGEEAFKRRIEKYGVTL